MHGWDLDKEGKKGYGRHIEPKEAVVEFEERERKQIGDALFEEIASRYEFERYVGHGAMSCVYRAKDRRTQRIVALKVAPEGLIASGRQGFFLQREAVALTTLRSPRVVSALDFGSYPRGGKYLALEWLEGPTLESFMFATYTSWVATAVRIVSEVLEGLEAVHAVGLVHCDLKPSNLIDTQEGIKIFDFGLATLTKGLGDCLFEQGKQLGTPRYMSPEQLNGVEVDARSDLFACGLLLYQLMTGRAPYSGTFQNVVTERIHGSPAPFSPRDPEPVPERLQAVALRALAREPKDRFQTAVEMREALLTALA